MTTPAIKTKLIVGADSISKELGSIKTASTKLDTRLQVVGLSILSHIEEHHNITLFNDLLSSMGKGHRKSAMVDWALKFGQIAQNVGKDGKLDPTCPYKWDKVKVTDLVAAEEMPWFDCKPEKLEEVLDLQKMLAAILRKASKEGAQITPGQEELLKGLKALAPVK